MNTTTYTLTGNDAIRLADDNTFTLRKYADPIDGARNVTIEEAREIAKEDASLIYANVFPSGWNAEPNQTAGYHFGDYFDVRGKYIGPDDDGVEPTFDDATLVE